MRVFGNDRNIRGCFSVFRLNTQEGRGTMLNLPKVGPVPTSNYSDPIVIVALSYTQQEKIHYKQCFNNRVYTYAFGHNPEQSVLSVNFVGFLISETNIIEQLNSKYSGSRVSIAKEYAQLSVGGATPLQGFIIGMSSSTMDSQHSLQNFQLQIGLVESQPSGSSSEDRVVSPSEEPLPERTPSSESEADREARYQETLRDDAALHNRLDAEATAANNAQFTAITD